MKEKRCPQCDLIKSSEDYYISNRKCKDCVKFNVGQRRLLNLATPEGIEKERTRHREKYHRLGYKDKDKYKPTYENKKLIQERYKNKYPEKIKVRKHTTNLKPFVVGNQLHHWNYNVEYAKDVIELSENGHNSLHRKLEYDKVKFIYNTLDGVPLDTKEKTFRLH